MKKTRNLHASAVLLGEHAVLIRGPAGAGKTSLALALVAQAGRGQFARIIGDDRIMASVAHGRLVVRSSPALEGLVERRGLGLTPVPHETAGLVALVIDLDPVAPERLPGPEDLVTEIDGVTLPRLKLSRGAADCDLVLAALALFTAHQ